MFKKTEEQQFLNLYSKVIQCPKCASFLTRKIYKHHEMSGDLFTDLKVQCIACNEILLEKSYWMDNEQEAKKLKSLKLTLFEYIEQLEQTGLRREELLNLKEK